MGQSKYSLEFKKSCVEKILQDHLLVTALANELSLDRTMLHKWCRFYELHGTAGLQRRRNRLYDVKFKLKVLKTIATGKFSIKEAAVKFNIAAESSILNWQRDYGKSGILGLENKLRGRSKIMSDYKRKKRKSDQPLTREEELLLENERLRTKIAVLKKLDALILKRKKPKS